ncbi:AlwI family type II restriction endonuclease [Sulfurimonas sp.]|uniref:AlwI family type II restriction endonuclease n=1 Tax=Sulfurimonas sp. TaxID=2022749 RepID=UPI00356AF6D6
MRKAWSISTTVRNPERLRNFLITLKEIENEEWNHKTQIEFQARLVKNRYYGFGSTQFYNNLPSHLVEHIQDINHIITLDEAVHILEERNYPEGIAIRGRTSYKPLEKIGLASIVDKKIKLTSLGKYLLEDDYDLGEMFFKSFLKWQYPNPVDRDFRDSEIYNLKPFILTLHLINEVNKLCKSKSINAVGISKTEFEIFGQTLLNYKDLKTQAKTLVEFRLALKALKTYKEKKEFIQKYIEEFLADFTNIDNNNLSDYADNTIRYFRLTRLIHIRGNGFYIDLEPRRMVEINALLETYDGSSDEFSKKDYIEYISDINLPVLPWQSEQEQKKISDAIKVEIEALESELQMQVPLDAKNVEELREYRKKLQNIKIKKELQNLSKIDETIEALNNIRNLDLKPSIALEKYITMALNIINDAKEIKANSLVGDDNEFIFTAPANKPDIECYYESFNSICEVTMLNGRDQWHNEGQPVMRHFRDFENASSTELNYCLFIAPKLHRDTINTFWFSLKYEYEGTKQKIVPFTINQIIEILEVIKKLKEDGKLFSHLQFQKILDEIVALKDEDSVNNSDDWLRAIPEQINKFKREVL